MSYLVSSLDADYNYEPCPNHRPGQLDGFSCVHFCDLQTAGWEIMVGDAENGILREENTKVLADGGDVYVP